MTREGSGARSYDFDVYGRHIRIVRSDVEWRALEVGRERSVDPKAYPELPDEIQLLWYEQTRRLISM